MLQNSKLYVSNAPIDVKPHLPHPGQMWPGHCTSINTGLVSPGVSLLLNGCSRN